MVETSKQSKKQKEMADKIKEVVGESNIAGAAIVCSSGCEYGEGNLEDAIKNILSMRDNVVMVRVNKESLAKLDELVEAGIVGSRSEAAAFLIGEGIKSKRELFDQISEKIGQIKKTREELRQLLKS